MKKYPKYAFVFWNIKNLVMLVLLLFFHFSYGQIFNADIIIYGATSSGIAAAIESSRLGRKVILIEPYNRIGGLTTGGLGQTDIGNKQVIGGIALEFYQNIKIYYENPNNWIWQKKIEYEDSGQTRSSVTENAMWTFEPSAALKVFNEMISKEKVKLFKNERLNRRKGVIKSEGKIKQIVMESGKIFEGSIFIDATYEGDLMATSGVSYTVGRESNSKYGESLNGNQPFKTGQTLNNILSKNSAHHNFINGVDPYIIPGDPKSGLLPYINKGGPGNQGEGDKAIQAYCFRMTLTNHPKNKIPFKKPVNYDELNYELLFRNYEAAKGSIEEMYSYGDPLVPWINSPMPNRKTDTNNQKGFSTDFIGQNWDYPEANYQERQKIIDLHREYQQGLMWTLAFHPRIPKKVREKVSKWGTCKDEYEEGDGWQSQLYIRESRRMEGSYVMTQKNCERIEVVNDPIGMAAYGMDSHNVRRYVNNLGFVENEGNVEAHVKKPYPISLRSVIPKRNECNNLIVPVCLSASHIAFGSIRMEPVFMVLGQSSAIIANYAVEKNIALQDINYFDLKSHLIKRGQILY